MKNLSLFLVSSVLALPAFAEVTLTDADLVDAYHSKSYSMRISCHDPSVFMDTINFDKSSPRYYIYGSHLGRGYTSATSDYQEWVTFKAGEESSGTANSLFANVSGSLVNFADAYSTHAVTQVKDKDGNLVTFGNFDAHGWQYSGNTVSGMQWAPDVIWNPTMNKWLMYMSLNGDNWCSSIVCFASDSPQGPWIYQGPVVFSGFNGTFKHNSYAAADDYKHTDLEIALGAQSSLPTRYNVGSKWGNYWPNCIDPCVFYDKEGKLWMSYGSWSGGVFILRLDENTGLRDYTVTYPYQVNGTTATPEGANQNCTCDPYFGKKIAGGYYVSGEASYIERIGDYYYLFMSYGGLTAAGGYQIRVFRSENPDGPYKDCCTTSGIDAVYSAYRLNYGSDANRDEGVKLMAGYQWNTMSKAELAQGHNSAIVDHKGRALLVYHTRFNDGSEGHQVRVHQLFLNEDQWLCASPYEFSGEEYSTTDYQTRQLYSAEEVADDYQFMAHPYRQNTAAKTVETPVNISLNADGTVSGSYTGTWSLVNGTSYINLTLTGTKTGDAAVTFKGVLTSQTIDNTDIPALCFTALSSSDGNATSSGAALQTRALSVWGSKAAAKAAIKYTADKISIPATVTSDLTLSSGLLGANVTWTSGNTNILSDDGKVISKGNTTLTATIRKDGYVYVKTYDVNVNSDATPTYYPECGDKEFGNAFWTTFSDTYKLSKGSKCIFKFYNYTKGELNWQNWSLYGANKAAGSTGYSEYFGIRCDSYDNTSASSTGCTNDFNWSTFLTDMDGSLVEMECSYTSAGTFKMVATITTQTGTVYNYSYQKSISLRPSQLTLFFVTEASWIGPDGPNGESLGIENVFDEEVRTNENAIFDLFGRRHEMLQPGINIVGGRKVIRL